jgi:hypothetical protein
VVDFDANRGEFTVRAEFMHGYAATKLMWRPEDLTGDAADLLATSGDYLRLWHVPNDGVQVRPHAVLYDPLARLHPSTPRRTDPRYMHTHTLF